MAAPVAATAAVAAGKAAAADAAGVVRAVLNALEKPIYSDVVSQTVTHVAKNGDVIVRTTTKGWTIPLGVPVLIVGSIMVWEVGLALAKAWAGTTGAIVKGAEDLVAVTEWVDVSLVQLSLQIPQDIIVGLAGVFGQKISFNQQGQPSQNTIKVPPTFMASLSFVGQQLLAPGGVALATLNNLISQLQPK